VSFGKVRLGPAPDKPIVIEAGFRKPHLSYDSAGGCMSSLKVSSAAAAVCAGLLALPSAAHHSFAAEFDAANCRDFTGTLTDLDWQSPHAYFYLDVVDDEGNVENWSFQTYALITL
jgi:hypothetical protein